VSQIVVFGEAMVRFSPPGRERIEQATDLEMRIGGAELNVAVGVARLGVSSSWISRLPRNPLGRFLENQARQFGVDTSRISWSDTDRMGLYFIEFGAAPRPTSVIYDRADSAMSKIVPGEIDWAAAFEGAKVFHTTGITPALSDGAREATIEALQAAKTAGLTVSFDPNYREKLWSRESAQAVIRPLMEYVDIIVTNRSDAEHILGVSEGDDAEVAHAIADTFGAQVVAIPERREIAPGAHQRRSVAVAGGTRYESKTYDIEMVDMVGGGDSFVAGFLYGWLNADIATAVEYGTAYAALKHTNPGDINYATLEELERTVQGGGMHIGR
jgi:2-dehydro-3-deoxygluconokinase